MNLPHHQIDIKTYYNSSLNLVPKDATILFFSDDLEKCGESFTTFFKDNGFSNNLSHTKDEIEALYLMSHCGRGCITGNSTFSYWGAYFLHQNYPDALCIYPRHFGRGLPTPKNLYPPFGKVIDSV
jgi:hypothetical protein